MAKKQKVEEKKGFRSNVKDLRFVLGSELTPHPKNPRRHSKAQREAFRRVVEEDGFNDVVLAVEKDGKLIVVDGHMRRDEYPDEMLPVIVLDLSEAETERALASLDYIGSMADYDKRALADLVKNADNQNEVMRQVHDKFVEQERKAMEKIMGTGQKPEYPIVPEFDEKYDYVVIMCSSKIDFAWLQTQLGLKRMASYKDSTVGLGRVIRVEDFQKLWAEATGKELELPETEAQEEENQEGESDAS